MFVLTLPIFLHTKTLAQASACAEEGIMSRKYKFSDNDKLYFISFSVIHWIDLFIRKEYKDIMIDSWQYCQKHKDLEIYGWCIMSSHVHMIVGSKGRELYKIIGEMKSYTSTQLKKAIYNHPGESRKSWMLTMMRNEGIKNSNNKSWQLWQQDSHPIEILYIEMFYQKLNYIHLNPMESGIVELDHEYLYSSARDFHNRKGLIELSYIV